MTLITIHYAVCMVYGKHHKTVECPYIRLSVPSIDSSGGGQFATEIGASNRYRSTAAATALHVGCVNCRLNIYLFNTNYTRLS